jgi:hypothetical protein
VLSIGWMDGSKEETFFLPSIARGFGVLPTVLVLSFLFISLLYLLMIKQTFPTRLQLYAGRPYHTNVHGFLVFIFLRVDA